MGDSWYVTYAECGFWRVLRHPVGSRPYEVGQIAPHGMTHERIVGELRDLGAPSWVAWDLATDLLMQVRGDKVIS